MSSEVIATAVPVPAQAVISNTFDEYGIPVSVLHYRPKGMRHEVWDAVHALEEPIVRGSNKFTHICLLCTKRTSKWDNALCRISNTSNAMKHFRSRHPEWFAQRDENDVQGAGDVAVRSRATRAPIMKPKGNVGGSPLKRVIDTVDQVPDMKRIKGLPMMTIKDNNKSDGESSFKTYVTNDTSPSLVDKVVLITGASGGIGAAIARRMAAEGAKVVIGARRIVALEEISEEIVKTLGEEMKQRLLVRATDVTRREEVHNLVNAAEQAFGPVDILVNNAGVMPFELMRNVNQDSWDRTIDVNCKGVLNGIAAVLPQMLSRQAGHIVNITSDAGRKVFPGLGVYSASKMFVEGISQALRLENVGSGLRVTTIQPGNVATDLVAHGQDTIGGDTEAMELYGTPSGYQVLQPEDIANAVVYAVVQPPFVAVNEILVEPRDEPI